MDHPVFSPKDNALMRESGIRIVDGKIYAPEGINKFLKRGWELLLKTGKPYNSNTPPSTSSDDSDSTPPKRNQRTPTIARKKPASKQPPGNSAKSPNTLALPNRPTLIDPNNPNAVFTGPPPNATEAEINAWVDLWFHHHKFTPGSTTPPQWVQTWIDNAHAYFTCQTAVNASSNNPGTNTQEEDPLAPPAAAAANAAPPPPPGASNADLSEAVSAWISSNITIIDGVFHCLDLDQPVPQCVQDQMDHVRAQIESVKQENQLIAAQIASMKDVDRKAKGIQQQLPAKRKLPTANTEDNHPLSATEPATTNDPPAAEEADANQSTAENATIKIDAQGDTVEDPIIIDKSTSNSNNNSADEADKST